MTTCSGPSGSAALAIIGSLIARRLTVVWSGTASSQPINSMTDAIRPSAWRSASLNAVRSTKQVWIALSEYVACPPGVDRGAAVHASRAASLIHIVRLPRRRSPASYSAQFVTLNGILGMWCRRSALCLWGMAFCQLQLAHATERHLYSCTNAGGHRHASSA